MSLAAHLRLGGRWTFVGGKGGVGKTTVSAALGIELADRGDRVILLSSDPAHSLGDAMGVELEPEPRPIQEVGQLEALEVDGEYERDRFLDAHRTSIAALLDRGTYLDPSDIEQVTGLTLPGMDELAALLRLLALSDPGDRRVVVDTAPTGHTLRLLQLPRQALAWIEALEAMESKHAAIAGALAGGYSPDDVADFVQALRADLTRAATILSDPEQTRFVLVTSVEPVVLAETRRYAAELEELGIALGGIVVNRQAGEPRADAIGDRMIYVPRLPDLEGIEGLRRFAEAATDVPGRLQEPASSSRSGATLVGDPLTPPLDRRMYFVAGKGGVGKSTTAAALAVRLVDAGRTPALLLSVDPAGSLAEVLDEPVDRSPRRHSTLPGLTVQQLDAETAWAEFHEQYEREVEGLFAGLTGGAVSASHDRAVVERLLDLAPPGLDELMALAEVIDSTEDATYDALVVDTAPTGHFIRLLEMPAVALEWTHTLLRLLLKYREVIGLGDLAERVLRLSRSLKSLQASLRDSAQVTFVTVALPESLSIPESERLLARLAALGLPPGFLLINRALDDDRIQPDAQGAVDRLLEVAGAMPTAAAPRLGKGPEGVEALREFAAGWKRLASG